MKTFWWLVKREFWEHRGSFLWAPIVTGAVFVLLNLMAIAAGAVFGPRFGVGPSGLQLAVDHIQAGQVRNVGLLLDVVTYSASGMIGMVLGFVVLFYCLGSLYDDRRDRSVLFWKSLPLSDAGVVLSKVVSATLVAPAIAAAAAVATGLLLLAILLLVLALHGVPAGQALMHAHPLQAIEGMLLSVPDHLLWGLPTIGWLMLCSAWARSKPFVWAVALPVAAGLLASWFSLLGVLPVSAGWFWQHVPARLLAGTLPRASYVFGPFPLNDLSAQTPTLPHFMAPGTVISHVAMPQLWVGVAAGLAMLAGAVWLRRWRDAS